MLLKASKYKLQISGSLLIIFILITLIVNKPIYYQSVSIIYSIIVLILLAISFKKFATICFLGVILCSSIIRFYYIPNFNLRAVVIKVPENFEGYLIMGFSNKSNNDAVIKDNKITFDFDSSLYKVHSLKYFEDIQAVPLIVKYSNSEKNNSITDFENHLFYNKIDTLKIMSRTVFINSLLITRKSYNNSDKELKKVEMVYQNQKKYSTQRVLSAL